MTIDAITIADSQTGCAASIAPALGFNCFSFVAQVHGRSIEALWHDPQFREGTTRPSRSGIPILFPFAGRIREGRYRYRGREYQLERNDPQGVNAIHGFVYTRPWRVIEQTAASLTGEFQASLDDPAILSRWPSDFRIDAPPIRCRARNCMVATSFTIPATSRCPGGSARIRTFASRWRADHLRRHSCDSRRRSSGIWNNSSPLEACPTSPIPMNSCGFRVGDREFDSVFTGLGTDRQIWSGSVTDTAAGITTTIRFGQPFHQCVVFIPPHREAICLEPYSGVPNAFELVERGIEAGLHELAPGETCAVEVAVEVACNSAPP